MNHLRKARSQFCATQMKLRAFWRKSCEDKFFCSSKHKLFGDLSFIELKSRRKKRRIVQFYSDKVFFGTLLADLFVFFLHVATHSIGLEIFHFEIFTIRNEWIVRRDLKTLTPRKNAIAIASSLTVHCHLVQFMRICVGVNHVLVRMLSHLCWILVIRPVANQCEFTIN